MDNKKTADEVAELGFNDDELADIMNEIEDLERDLNAEPVKAKPVAAVQSVKEDLKTSKVTEVLEEFVQEPVDKVLPMTAKAPTVTHMKKSEGQNTSMDFNISGNMTVNLSFTVSGQTINLSMDEATGLVIEMHGGAKFCLPLSNVSDVKKKAS